MREVKGKSRENISGVRMRVEMEMVNSKCYREMKLVKAKQNTAELTFFSNMH